MRPCQSVRGLPPDVAAWMRRWTRTIRVHGRCYIAMQGRPAEVHQGRGVAVFLDKGRPQGALHTWGEMGRRVVDPTAHQFGDGPIALYSLRPVCPSCGRLTFAWEVPEWEQWCWCFCRADGLRALVMGPAVYSEPGALDIEAVYAALRARRAA